MVRFFVRWLPLPANKFARTSLSLLLSVSLLLPPQAALPTPLYAQSETPPIAEETVPPPIARPVWPEVTTYPDYTPVLEPAAEPGSLVFPAPEEPPVVEAATVDAEAGKSGLVVMMA